MYDVSNMVGVWGIGLDRGFGGVKKTGVSSESSLSSAQGWFLGYGFPCNLYDLALVRCARQSVEGTVGSKVKKNSDCVLTAA